MVRPGLTRKRIWTARILALFVDGAQIFFLPFFGVGFLSPANDVIDVATAVTMIALLGWHWAFLPTFVAELVPGVGLIPTWTAAVWLATWKRS